MLIESLASGKVVKVPGTAIFMTSTSGRTPVALLHSLKHYQAIHQRVIFMTLTTEDEPWVPPSRRVEVEKLGDSFWRVTGRFGFMQKPNVPRLLRQCAAHDLDVDPDRELPSSSVARSSSPAKPPAWPNGASTSSPLPASSRSATRDLFPDSRWGG